MCANALSALFLPLYDSLICSTDLCVFFFLLFLLSFCPFQVVRHLLTISQTLQAALDEDKEGEEGGGGSGDGGTAGSASDDGGSGATADDGGSAASDVDPYVLFFLFLRCCKRILSHGQFKSV